MFAFSNDILRNNLTLKRIFLFHRENKIIKCETKTSL